MSKVQICNRALSTYLGASRINSLTEASPEAEQCNLHYDDTLQSLLEMHRWVFAKGRQILAVQVNDRVGEWGFKYARPSAALKIHWVNDAETARILMAQNMHPDAPRDVSQTDIYSDVENATCEFTKLITDTTKFPQYFADALSAALAANIAMPITEDIKRAQNAMSQAGDKLDMARVLDEEETPPLGYRTVPDYLTMRGVY